jgi:hypothetical protein
MLANPEAAREEPETVDREGASRRLFEKFGIRFAPQSLANLHVKGKGPPVRRFGRRPLYPVQALDEWARANMSPVVSSSSDANVRAGVG